MLGTWKEDMGRKVEGNGFVAMLLGLEDGQLGYEVQNCKRTVQPNLEWPKVVALEGPWLPECAV